MLRLTRQQLREIDRRAVEEYGMPSILLMENASRGAAEMIDRRFGRGRFEVLCGRGNNGGDGLAIARHLHARGREVVARLIDHADAFTGDAAVNLQITRRMGLVLTPDASARHTSDTPRVVIDAIFGTGLTREPAGPHRLAIDELNTGPDPVVAIDVPSGLDCDRGVPLGVAVRAALTVTFVAEKIGFAHEGARRYTGEVVVADIGCPPELIARVAGPSRA